MAFSPETQALIDAAFEARDKATGQLQTAKQDTDTAGAAAKTAADSSALATEDVGAAQAATTAALAGIAAELEAGLPTTPALAGVQRLQREQRQVKR